MGGLTSVPTLVQSLAVPKPDSSLSAVVVSGGKQSRIDVLRYKSKKRVRVHRGARADLTALEIIAVGGIGVEKETKTEAKPKGKAKAAPKKAAAPKGEAVAPAAAAEVTEEKKETPKRPARRSKKETE